MIEAILGLGETETPPLDTSYHIYEMASLATFILEYGSYIEKKLYNQAR